MPVVDEVDARFGALMVERRAALKMTQRDLAEALGKRLPLDVTAISRIEKGVRSLRLPEAVAIAQVLGISLAGLVLNPSDRLDNAMQDLRAADASFSRAADQYGRALWRAADAADTVGDVADNIEHWLTVSMPAQTPGRLAASWALSQVQAAIEREALDADGKFLRLLVDALKRDMEALGE